MRNAAIVAALATFGAAPDLARGAGVAATASAAAWTEDAHAAADAAYRSGAYREAAGRYREIVAALEGAPLDAAGARTWLTALLDLARAEATVGNGAACRAAMERVLTVAPDAILDPDVFSPALRKEFEQARARVAAQPRHRLRVTSPDGTGEAFVQGRAFGPVPAETSLPAGRYQVTVASAQGSGFATVDLRADDAVSIQPIPPPDLRASPPQPVSVAIERGGPEGWMRPTAWVTTGLAGAALGVSVWQAVAASSAYSEARGMLLPDGSLRPGVDPGAYAATLDAYASARRNAWIAGGSALVLGAAATTLWLLAPGAPVEPTAGGAAIRF